MITTLELDGMRSVHCVRAVFTALAGVPGIVRAEVAVGRAVLEHAQPLDPAALAQAVGLAGYGVRRAVTEARRLPLLDNGRLGSPPPGDDAYSENQ